MPFTIYTISAAILHIYANINFDDWNRVEAEHQWNKSIANMVVLKNKIFINQLLTNILKLNN